MGRFLLLSFAWLVGLLASRRKASLDPLRRNCDQRENGVERICPRRGLPGTEIWNGPYVTPALPGRSTLPVFLGLATEAVPGFMGVGWQTLSMCSPIPNIHPFHATDNELVGVGLAYMKAEAVRGAKAMQTVEKDVDCKSALE